MMERMMEFGEIYSFIIAMYRFSTFVLAQGVFLKNLRQEFMEGS
jgi:hypothetical protein